MRRTAVILGTAALLAAAAAGCSRWGAERPLGSLTPEAAPAEDADTGAGAVADELNPARPAAPAEAPREGPRAEPPPGLTRSGERADYQARLGEVGLPLPQEAVPLLAEVGTGDADEVTLVDAILAEVNGEVITREDILGPLRPQLARWRRQYSPEAFRNRCREVIDMRLREEISRRLVLQEAEARLTEEEKKQVDLTLGQMLKDLAAQAGSTLLLEEKLKARGLSLEKHRQQERRRLLVQRYLQKIIGPKIHVTHSELLNYYNQVRAERYEHPTRVRLGLITIKKREVGGEQEARALAEAVHARAAAGEDFTRLARRYSVGPMAGKGGDWGFVTKGAFRVRAVDEVLFGLEKGEVGPIVETDDAFYIVKALDRQQGRVVPFTEVQEELERELRDRKFNERVNRYIQDLYRRGYVRVVTGNL